MWCKQHIGKNKDPCRPSLLYVKVNKSLKCMIILPFYDKARLVQVKCHVTPEKM